MKDLSLVPIEELTSEIFSRSKGCVISWVRENDVQGDKIYVDWDGESLLTLLGLAQNLGAEIYNNFNEETGDYYDEG